MGTATSAGVNDERLRAAAAAVGAPDFVVPWLDRFYEPAEIDLVLEAAACRGCGLCSTGCPQGFILMQPRITETRF